MGWQEQQASARAREQQRQADQRASSARQAESIRQENQARDRANAQRANADMFASNARRDSERRARDLVASDKAHTDRMEQIKRDGRNIWPSASPLTPTYRASDELVSSQAGSYPVKKKTKGGGWLFIFLIVGVIYAINRSGSSSSGSLNVAANSAPIIDGSSQTPVVAKLPDTVTDTSAKQDTPADSTNAGSAIGVAPELATAANDPQANLETGGQFAAPSSMVLEPVDRPDAVYPAAAMITRPTGPVIVMVGVQTNGTVISATPESGDPLLMPAALEAAKRWTFKPYPYEPGTSVRTMRIEFPFKPPVN